MELVRKYPFNARAERAGNVVRVHMTGVIYPDSKNAAAVIAEKLVDMQEGDELEVYMRDFEGGNMQEGFKVFEDFSALKPTVYVDGEVCSMATVIMLAGKKIVATKRAKIMTHRPKFDPFSMSALDHEDMVQVAEKGKQLTEQIAGMYAERTGLKVEEVLERFLPKGKDVWMTADQALQVKLVDEVTGTRERTVPIRALQAAKTADERLDLWAAVNVPEQQPNNNNPMKGIAKKLGLADDATEAQIEAAIEAALHAKKTAEDAVAAHATAEKARTVAELTSLLDAGMKANRLKKEERDQLLKDAEGNPGLALSMAKTLVGNVPAAPAVPISAQLGNGGGVSAAAAAVANERLAWDYNMWASKDPKGLEKMMNERPEEFKALRAARPSTRG